MTFILITVITIICISCSGISRAQAEVIQSPVGFEQKVYTEIDIDEDFDDSSVLVVMDKFSSGFNKSHSGLFSKISFVKSIKDLTNLTGNITNKLYLNKYSFRQILKIDLKEHSKQKVINAINQIQKLDGVLWAGVNGYNQPCDTIDVSPKAMDGERYKKQWGLHGYNGSNVDNAWNYATGSKEIKVGIIDSGIAKHDDLNDNVTAGWNFISNNDDTNDTYGHGTAVAGIIGATGATENGIVGVNWKVQLVPLKVDFINNEGKCKFDSSAIVNAIIWAIDNNIDILNLSGSGTTENIAYKAALNNFTGLFVCSAGNDANNNDNIRYYPSDYAQGQEFSNRVISVGAINSNGEIASFSNYGNDTVSIFAPGVGITTTCPLNSNVVNGIYDALGYTDNFGGTSAAAPFVTGVAALLYIRYDCWLGGLEDEDIAAQVKTTILNRVVKDTRYDGKCVSGGRLNATGALRYCQYMPAMNGYGYNDGWYYWKGKVDLEIQDPYSFGFDQNDELYINKPTNLKFYMSTLSAFNAVREIDISMTFTLRNSAGEIVPIDRNESIYHGVTVGLISNSKHGFCNFTINTNELAYNEKYTLTWECKSERKDKSYSYTRSFTFNYDDIPSSCIATDSLITLSGGSQVAVQDLTGNEELLVWNMHTGTFDSAPILFIDKEAQRQYEVTNLYFSDGTSVKVIDEHGFWDFDLNRYVFLRKDASKYIGHWFNKQTVEENGNLAYTKVQLVDVKVQLETTSAWSPITYGHLCYYVNGMLSMPGATTGFINIFEVDANTMKIDEESYLADIEKYGLFTYEEFTEICPVPKTIFEAVNGQYLKVAIGKGLTSIKEIQSLISRYSKFW